MKTYQNCLRELLNSVTDSQGRNFGSIERLLEVDHGPCRFDHRVAFVVVHKLGQRIKTLATANVKASVLNNNKIIKLIKQSNLMKR